MPTQEAHFPTTFTDEPLRVTANDVPRAYRMPFLQLANKGLAVVAGLERAHVSDLTEIAGQFGTIEYCANDIKKRWANEDMTEKQLAKDDGRGVVLLESLEDGSTYGFGWEGKSSDEERGFLPECLNTFALRLHEKARGNKLGSPFSRAIVTTGMEVWNAHRVGLETWGSNTAAVRSYLGAGAVLVTTADGERPTQIVDQPGVYYKEVDGQPVPYRRDTRLYMQFPQSFPHSEYR